MRKGPVMILLPCPWCGPREATEFAHVGEVSARPDPGSVTPAQWRGYLYLRANPCGWTTETWYHRMGCRQFFVLHSTIVVPSGAPVAIKSPSREKPMT